MKTNRAHLNAIFVVKEKDNVIQASLRLCLDNLKLTERNRMERSGMELKKKFHSIVWILYDGMELIFHSIVWKIDGTE